MGFVWSQSALKDLEKDTTCPLRWSEQWLNRAFKVKATEPQDIGNYGEYLIIGKNAKADAVTDLPKTSKGEKTAVQKRVEAQAKRVKEMFDPKSENYIGLQIKDVQVPLSGALGDLPVQGTADIIAVEDTNGDVWLIDIKFTEDAFSTRTGYGWGHPIEEQDLVQQVLYSYLYHQQTGLMPKVKLIVVEYGTGERIRNIDLTIRDWRVTDMVDRFVQANNVVNLYQENGWVAIPSEKECEQCPLDCPLRKIPTSIFSESYVY
jgi:hypothetical protein